MENEKTNMEIASDIVDASLKGAGISLSEDVLNGHKADVLAEEADRIAKKATEEAAVLEIMKSNARQAAEALAALTKLAAAAAAVDKKREAARLAQEETDLLFFNTTCGLEEPVITRPIKSIVLELRRLERIGKINPQSIREMCDRYQHGKPGQHPNERS